MEPDHVQDYPAILLRFRVESCTLKKDVATQGPGQGAPRPDPTTPCLGHIRKLELKRVSIRLASKDIFTFLSDPLVTWLGEKVGHL